MVRALILAALCAVPLSAALAQDAPVNGEPPTKIRSVTITPGDKCPESTNGEIVVCQTLEEPYRIPKDLRVSPPSAANRTWASRVAGVDDAVRESTGLPNSCSPTGTGGGTGCTQVLIDQWRTERREAQQDRRTAPR